MQRTLGHILTIGLGLVGWLIVTIGLPLLGAARPQLDVQTVLLFAVVILVARALAWKPTTGTVLSLDSAYFRGGVAGAWVRDRGGPPRCRGADARCARALLA